VAVRGEVCNIGLFVGSGILLRYRALSAEI